MYYYRIRIFEPYDGSDDIMIAHDHMYTGFELSGIVQDVIDSVVKDYANQDEYTNRNNAPCNQKINYLTTTNYSEYPEGLLGIICSRLKYDYGFEIILPLESISIQRCYLFNKEFNDDNPSYLFNRYKDLVLGECNDCFRENRVSYDGCPVENKRRKVED